MSFKCQDMSGFTTPRMQVQTTNPSEMAHSSIGRTPDFHSDKRGSTPLCATNNNNENYKDLK